MATGERRARRRPRDQVGRCRRSANGVWGDPSDLAFRVDALRRTADLVRADVVAMVAQGNDADAAKATTVVEALEALADAEEEQQGVSRATRELGKTLASVC